MKRIPEIHDLPSMLSKEKLKQIASKNQGGKNQRDGYSFELAYATSLVVCATGDKALDLRGFGMLQSGSVVASVTSADDEFDLACLTAGYEATSVGDGDDLVRYEENRPGGRHFFLVANGNAANFIHGAVIGPAIQLIEGEKLKAIKALIEGKISVGGRSPAELDVNARREVAEIWIEHFL